MQRIFGLGSWASGAGLKTLGLLRSRGPGGSRFESVGAIDIDPIACLDFKLLTGAEAHVADLWTITMEQLRAMHTRRPDVIVMSPPCKGFSGCLPEGVSKTEKYELLNKLALRMIDLAVETWAENPPAAIMLENVPRIVSRGADLLEKMRVTLRAADYEIDERPHDCGEFGGLAQSRMRFLLMARHRKTAPTPMLVPPSRGLKSMASVLWKLPVPTPDSEEGGPHHRLPQLSELNWLRLASIPAGQDWRAIPERVHVGKDVDARLPGDGDETRHAGKYGVQDDSDPAHAVIAEARTGKGWADVKDPRVANNGKKQNGGRGVNDSSKPSHSVLAEGSVANTWASVNDPRLDCNPRTGTMGVGDCERPSTTVIGTADIHNSMSAIADPRSDCHRREDSIGVSDPARPYKTPVIGHQKVENSPSSVADPRVAKQRRGNYGVQDPAQPSATVRAQHPARTAPSSIADGRLFHPTHELVAGQRWTGNRKAWVAGDFRLVGPDLKLGKGGRPTHVIILAPDGTVHRPMTTAELMRLQNVPVWATPGDPTELELYDPRGQWVQLHGNDQQVREHVGNAVPPATAQAIGDQLLRVLEAGASVLFELTSGGIWVAPELVSMQAAAPVAPALLGPNTVAA